MRTFQEHAHYGTCAWDGNEQYTIWTQHSFQLKQAGLRIGDIFQHTGAEHTIKRIGRKWQSFNRLDLPEGNR